MRQVSSNAARPALTFGVLGPLQVKDGDEVLPLPGAKERALLAHLVACVGRTVSTDELAEALWNGDTPRTATKVLQNHVLRLRKVLEPHRDGDAVLLVTDPGGYRLDAPRQSVDALEFERLTLLGRRAAADHRPAAAAETLRAALCLWRGRAYAGLESTSFGLAEARRLDELRLLAIEDRVAADLALGRAGELVHELESLVAADPLRERLWSLLMLALYRCGRQGEALGAHMRARRVLDEELGIDPGQELAQLHSRILVQDPSLDGTGPVTLHPELTPPGGPYVGRDRELEQLSAAWQLAMQEGSARVVVVRGPPGSGVSRLAAEFAARLADAGAPVDFVRPAPAIPRPTTPLAVAAVDQVAGIGATQAPRGVPAPANEHGGLPRPMPALLVADLRGGWDEAGFAAEPVNPAALTLILAHPGLRTQPAAQVIDLAPLEVTDVATVLAEYLGQEAAWRLAPDLLSATGGWPGPIHDAALSEARRLVAVKVNGSAVRVEQAVTTLDAYRDDLRSRVEESRSLLGIQNGLPPDRCPWKGLGPYQQDDEAPFAGRERLVAELLARVASSRLVVVVGASGSGKTSLLNAGLLASLAAGALPGSERWVLLRMRPGPRPRSELLRTARSPVEPAAATSESTEGTVLAPKSTERVILVVDQLEEIWTVCDDSAERSDFLDDLADALDRGSPITLVLACRSDHVGRLADHTRLAALLPAAALLVGSPTVADLRRVIEQPAEQAGLRLDLGLVDALVEDAGAEPGTLPLLSTSLTELWEGRSGRSLTLAAYVATGGLRGAVARVAEHAYQALDQHNRRSARLLFLRLAGPGTGDTVTRRAVSLEELSAFDDPTVRLVVEPLVQARLLTVNGDDVEVAHEALFREWPRLRAWLDEHATTRTVQRRLAEAARDWDEGGREPSELWRGSRLAGGLDVLTSVPAELTERERAFLLAGQAEQEAEHQAAEAAAAATARQNRRLRALLAGTAVLLVLALGAGTLAVQSRRTAQDQAALAAARELAAAAAGLADTDAELAVLLALEAVDRSARVGDPLPEAVGALHSAVTADRVLAVHDGVGGSISISPDGATYVTEGPEGSGMVDLRDTETGASVRKWEGHDVDINQVAFGPTGTLATTGDDGTLALWDPDTGRELQRITGDEGDEVEVVDPAFNADGTVASAHWFGSVQRVFEVGSDQPPREFRGPVWVGPGSVDPTGALVAYGVYGDDDWRIEVTEVADATVVLTLAGRFFSFPNGVRWSPDGRWIAAMIDEELRVWDARTGSLSRTFTGHEKLAAVLDWTADSTQVVTGGEDGTVRLWSLDGSAPVQLLSAASTAAGVTGVDYDDRTSRVLAGNFSVTQVTVFDARPEGGGEWLTLTSPVDPFAGTAFLPDGRLVTPGRESGVSMTDPRSGQATPTMADTQGVLLAEPSPDGQFLAVWRLDELSVVELASGRTRFTQAVSHWRAPLVAWHPDSTKLAVPLSATDMATTVFDLDGRVLATLFERAFDFDPLGVAFSPDGRTLVTGRSPNGANTSDWGVTFWDWRRATALLELPDEHAESMAFAPDGSSLALANPNGAVLIDPVTGQRQVALRGARGGVSAVAFSPDSTSVATAEVSGAITLWDAATGNKQLTLPGHDEVIGRLDFSPDGTMLASAGGDGLTRVWALDVDDLKTMARDRVSRTLTAEECRQYLHGVGC